ncbi:MAG: glycosyltransferase family 9 protein [Bacteroidales bacterium]|jgi:ADP-heptose:LPS heptosyltransferase|nr:glycosyltransferase family 9 protein [Bacteroidales bacterium]
MAHILIIRFSAIGDVAMTVPIVTALAEQHPEDCFTMVSQSFLAPLFSYCPSNVRFKGIDLKTGYPGLKGMYRLYKELSIEKYDSFADIHDVLRTKFLRLLFRLGGVKVKHINKGRKEKRLLTRKKNKVFLPLKTSTERYADVFRSIGLPVTADFHSIFKNSTADFQMIDHLTGKKEDKWIGIAPFAKHQGKIYPINRTEEILAYFAHQKVKIFLFGGGAKEKEILENWEKKYPNTISVGGKIGLAQELILMNYLDVMFSMDSANMHLASLTATQVVSVWGATHPYAGFYGYGQNPENAVQIDLFCRPCSIYGNKPCYRNDYACLMEISPKMIIGKISALLNN